MCRHVFILSILSVFSQFFMLFLFWHWIGHLISYSRFYELVRHQACFAKNPAARWCQKPSSEGAASYRPSVSSPPCDSRQVPGPGGSDGSRDKGETAAAFIRLPPGNSGRAADLPHAVPPGISPARRSPQWWRARWHPHTSDTGTPWV